MPMESIFLLALASVLLSEGVDAVFGEKAGASVGDGVDADVGSVGADVGDGDGVAVGAAVGDGVGAAVGAAVGDGLGAAVDAAVGDGVGIAVGALSAIVSVQLSAMWCWC